MRYAPAGRAEYDVFREGPAVTSRVRAVRRSSAR